MSIVIFIIYPGLRKDPEMQNEIKMQTFKKLYRCSFWPLFRSVPILVILAKYLFIRDKRKQEHSSLVQHLSCMKKITGSSPGITGKDLCQKPGELLPINADVSELYELLI